MFRASLILLSTLMCCVFSYKILVVFPYIGLSHFIAFEPLFKGLAEKGHNVTVISFFPQKNPLPNYRDVSFQNSNVNVQSVSRQSLPKFRLLKYYAPILLSHIASKNCEICLQDKNFVEFLKENNKFDVILTEVFNTNCFMGLVKKFKAPVIGLSTCTYSPWVAAWIGSSHHPAYIPSIFLDFSDHLSFIQRLENTLVYFYANLIFKYKMENPGNEFSKKYLGEDLFENGNIMYNISLILSNTHFSLNFPRPLTPADIEVGGIHLGTPKKLPSTIEKWVNDSSDGVIYFSMGSYIKGTSIPKNIIQAFLKAFNKLPHRVLWKWENETLEGKPDNVMIQKWMPQLDILCHPNVKAFISHGGLLGIIESVHCGVPVIVMPQWGDQFANAKALESSGGGIILYGNDVTENAVHKALKIVLSKEFKQKSKELSERFRYRSLPPLETAIYWVEYVARYKGAHHMKTAAVNMPLYQYYLLDVAVTLILIFSVIISILYACFKLLLRKLFGSGITKIKMN